MLKNQASLRADVVRFERVLVATDFSEPSRIAFHEAERWMEPSADVLFLHVLPADSTALFEGGAAPADTQRRQDNRLRSAQKEMKGFLKAVDFSDAANKIQLGSVPGAVHAEAASFGADLIVLGACRHLSSQHLYLGSQARALLWANASNSSVFVGRGAPSRSERGVQVALGTDFGACAKAAADRASAIIDWRFGEIHLVHALDVGVWTGETVEKTAKTIGKEVGWPTLREAAATRLHDENDRAFGGRASEHVLVGSPSTALVDFARNQKVDLLVVGTCGRRQEGPVTLGSVAADVAEKAGVSVLVVRR